jgi:hypothetical protein
LRRISLQQFLVTIIAPGKKKLYFQSCKQLTTFKLLFCKMYINVIIKILLILVLIRTNFYLNNTRPKCSVSTSAFSPLWRRSSRAASDMIDCEGHLVCINAMCVDKAHIFFCFRIWQQVGLNWGRN